MRLKQGSKTRTAVTCTNPTRRGWYCFGVASVDPHYSGCVTRSSSQFTWCRAGLPRRRAGPYILSPYSVTFPRPRPSSSRLPPDHCGSLDASHRPLYRAMCARVPPAASCALAICLTQDDGTTLAEDTVCAHTPSLPSHQHRASLRPDTGLSKRCLMPQRVGLMRHTTALCIAGRGRGKRMVSGCLENLTSASACHFFSLYCLGAAWKRRPYLCAKGKRAKIACLSFPAHLEFDIAYFEAELVSWLARGTDFERRRRGPFSGGDKESRGRCHGRTTARLQTTAHFEAEDRLRRNRWCGFANVGVEVESTISFLRMRLACLP